MSMRKIVTVGIVALMGATTDLMRKIRGCSLRKAGLMAVLCISPFMILADRISVVIRYYSDYRGGTLWATERQDGYYTVYNGGYGPYIKGVVMSSSTPTKLHARFYSWYLYDGEGGFASVQPGGSIDPFLDTGGRSCTIEAYPNWITYSAYTVWYYTGLPGYKPEKVQYYQDDYYRVRNLDAEKTYTVSYSGVGVTIEPSNVIYSFLNWNTAADGSGTTYEPGELLYSGNLTLNAQWHCTSGPVVLPTPIRKGYVFQGWYNSSTFVGNGGDEYSPTASVTLNAKWKEKVYTISYDGNGSTEGTMSPSVFTCGVGQSIPACSFLRPGYEFAGWNTKSDGSGLSYSENEEACNIEVGDQQTVVLYAIWKLLAPLWNVIGTDVLYDGLPHGITIDPIDPVEGVEILYSDREDGSFVSESPKMTEACSKDIWYVLKAPGWTPLKNSVTLKITKLLSEQTISKNLADSVAVYDGNEQRPEVRLLDTTNLLHLNVEMYAPGDVDGDGVLSANDVTLIQRYNAYQALSEEMRAKYPTYKLTGSALSAADVNRDGVVNDDDVTVLNAKFSGYEMEEGKDYTVSYQDNVNAGTGKAVITGKGNYGGTVTVEFEIAKADIGEGDEPGSGTVPEGGKSKYDVTTVYDGLGHSVDANGISSIRIGGVAPVVAYSLNGAEGWQADPFVFTNACVLSMWYRLQVPNYNDYIHEVQLTIKPKPIDDTTVEKALSCDAFEYDGTAKTPQVTVMDRSIFRWQFVEPFTAGDVDGDGVLTEDDVELIDQHIGYVEMDDSLKPFFEEFKLEGDALFAADYNSDGTVNDADCADLIASFYMLIEGLDYSLQYEDNIKAGTAKVVLSGLGNYGNAAAIPFAIERANVPVTELTIDWGQSSFVYDGQPKEPVITVKDRETTLTKGTHYLVEYKDNINVGTAKAIVKGIEPYVGEVTNEFTIAAASIGPGGGEEPGSGVIPVGGLSKFDATYVYDGEGHTINTQALYAVTLIGSTPSFSFSLDGETGWQNDPFVYTNVGEYVMWYKIIAPNYEDYKHWAKVTIQPLVLTVTFDANGGSCSPTSKTVTHGATYGTLPTPTWTGHVFAGWYTAASGGDEVKDSTAVSIMAPQTLYAHWVSVTGVSARQRYPWNGLVDIVVAFEGESNDVAKVDCSFIATNSATKAALSVASITRKGADSGKDNTWSRQFVWNAGADVGAVKIDDVAFTVAAGIPLGGVQLWENGPYWAECNVGATKPEESGYYFWWGDTVGYRYLSGIGWCAVDGSRIDFRFNKEYCSTSDKSNFQLQSSGYIDSTGNLVAKYDAATVHLGALWRMPTDAEFAALINNCIATWTMRNGVSGRLVTGKGAYSSKNIFLPAAGCVIGNLGNAGGGYWSSTPDSGSVAFAWRVGFDSEDFVLGTSYRYGGASVRPIREFDMANIVGGVATTHLPLDCSTGDRVSAGTEELTFSNLWDGDKEATVTIAQDGAAIFAGLSGEGVKTWTVDRNGRYELTHTTYNNGVAGKVETAVFVVEGKEVPVRELTIDWGQKSFVYDGQPKEPVITVKDRGTTLTKGTHYLVEYKDNVNVGTAKAIVTGIEPYVGVVMNTFTITKGTIPGGGEEPGTGTIPEGGLSKFDRTGVYNGKGQTIDLEKLEEAFAEVVGNDFTVQYAEGESGGLGQPALPAWTTVAPTVKDVGSMIVWYKVTNPNFEDFVHAAKVTVVPKELTDEMVQPGEDAFFFDGNDKKPTVDVIYEVDGQDICTTNDYTLVYGEKADAGWWVTVTGKGNYAGTVAKIVPVLKRPVAPPLVPSRSYTGKTQKPTIPTDSRWTTVSNPGGIDVGEYSNVVLRLTNTTDYKWKGGAEDQTDITLVFKVTKGNNGWSRQPDMKGWTYGETPSEPAMGQARYGTVKVAYRKAGADVSTETATRPELPGKYLARFWVDETENFIGVAVHEPYKDIAFEITGTGPEPSGDVTETTPVPVPHDWLDAYVAEFGGGDYETAANAKGRNGVSLWESYVAGLDPTDPTSQFTASIAIGTDGKPIITWKPALNGETAEGEGILKGERIYRICGKKDLSDATWTADIDPKGGVYRFYKITVELVK